MAGPLYLDWMDYAESLLGIDWSTPEAVAGCINKAQALWPSDIVVLPLWPMLAAGAARIKGDMAAKPRGSQPLRVLLGDERVRAQILDTINMLSVPTLALGLPEPGEFAVLAAQAAGLADPDIDEDLVDDAALYIADFLRIFAQSKIYAVILSEDSDALHQFYTPIEKVAAGYGWQFAIWDGASAILPGYTTVKIPAKSAPEAVLDMVRDLRT